MQEIYDEINRQVKDFREKTKNLSNLNELEEFKISVLGKSGFFSDKMKLMSKFNPEQKKEFGKIINDAKNELESIVAVLKEKLESEALNIKLQKEKIDITLPKRVYPQGSIHPITQAMEELLQIFSFYGFKLSNGPEIEDNFHNFDALNVPKNHPAREMQDTFFIDQDHVLRTHTSSVQIRTMAKQKPPLRIIAMGKTYRNESDQTHSPMFHQVEGLCIDDSASFASLKWLLLNVFRTFFENDKINIRLRSSFFPFTEPSAEVDISCTITKDEIKIGEGSDFLEVMGCGMVHPNVLKSVGIDPSLHKGFAFGGGIERFAMLKYGVADLRNFYSGDLRWLKHHNFSAFDIPSLVGGLAR